MFRGTVCRNPRLVNYFDSDTRCGEKVGPGGPGLEAGVASGVRPPSQPVIPLTENRAMTEYAHRSIVDRMRGAALLDVATYEEVEHDDKATGQAAVVVVIVAVCAAIGAVWRGGPSIIMAPIGAILSWLLWSAITYVIGDKLLGGTATWGELLRTLGFAQAPGVLMIF